MDLRQMHQLMLDLLENCRPMYELYPWLQVEYFKQYLLHRVTVPY
jgi:hypothetical protein